ncbi:MAG: hypothetical protein EZS28_038892 [Streblomastix strix]|uniref:Uncharacterized protein n=1 Tax=Streblomastix strix TaxID=222440 RepID=A0A5J4U6K1_9EUKA|nr:MAG: hypothetical protein EZS28_038892 [Streblomastix strix]
MGNGYGEFESAREILAIQRAVQVLKEYINQQEYSQIMIETDNTAECFSIAKAKAKGKWMDINNKTYRWEVEQRSGRIIKVVDGRGLFNKERDIRRSFEGLVSGNNSGFVRNKEQRQTQEILYFEQGQKSGRMRFNENLMGRNVCIDTLTDTNNRQSNKENSRGESPRNNDSTALARVALVDAAKENNSERKGEWGRERRCWRWDRR